MAGVLKIKAEKAMTEELFTEEEREEMMKKDGDFATRLSREEVSCCGVESGKGTEWKPGC